MARNNWTREELIVAFNLYCKTPFTKINALNPGIKDLANIIGRSTSAVALKLANFARLDPALQERNISGMKHGSKREIEIWEEFNETWEKLAYESELILSNYRGQSVETSANIYTNDLPLEGKERESTVKIRVNQSFFRSTILASYDNHCCITIISIPELLVAGHIIPWSRDAKNRMNPSNGLCMNALHDKAFYKGLMTITPDYFIRLSKKLLKSIHKSSSEIFFLPYSEKKIILPQKFLPDKEFLEYHNKEIFIH
jgi:putative restriction endonuclease